jgi:hypothetical protein
MLGAVAIKDLIGETDLYRLKSKLIRIILLIPPISIAILIIGWLSVITLSMVDRIKDYLD